MWKQMSCIYLSVQVRTRPEPSLHPPAVAGQFLLASGKPVSAVEQFFTDECVGPTGNVITRLVENKTKAIVQTLNSSSFCTYGKTSRSSEV